MSTTENKKLGDLTRHEDLEGSYAQIYSSYCHKGEKKRDVIVKLAVTEDNEVGIPSHVTREMSALAAAAGYPGTVPEIVDFHVPEKSSLKVKKEEEKKKGKKTNLSRCASPLKFNLAADSKCSSPLNLVLHKAVSDLLVIVQNGNLPESEVSKIAKQLVIALRRLHGVKHLHLDIAMNNILYDGENYYFCDLGMSLPLKNYPSSFFKNKENLHIIFPSYRAPEVWEDGVVSDKVDVFALGMTLLYLLKRKLFDIIPNSEEITSLDDLYERVFGVAHSPGGGEKEKITASHMFKHFNFTRGNKLHCMVISMLTLDANKRPSSAYLYNKYYAENTVPLGKGEGEKLVRTVFQKKKVDVWDRKEFTRAVQMVDTHYGKDILLNTLDLFFSSNIDEGSKKLFFTVLYLSIKYYCFFSVCPSLHAIAMKVFGKKYALDEDFVTYEGKLVKHYGYTVFRPGFIYKDKKGGEQAAINKYLALCE